MTIQRVTNLTLFSSTLRNVTQTQQGLFGLQEQISSGLKTRNFEGLNGQVEQFVELEVKINRTELFKQNNTILTARLQTASQSLDSITSAADDIKNLIISRRNGATGANLNFEQQVKNKLQTLADSMNVSFEGRYLFAGTATDTPPVPDISVAPNELGVPDKSYYKGAEASVRARADESVEFDFPVRGDDEAFQQIFAAVNLALDASKNNSDVGLKDAFTLVTKGQQNLVAAQTRVNTAIINVDSITERQSQLQAYWRGITEQVSRTDIVAASTKVASDQAVLQASYQVFARLSQLKLSDFLN